MCAAFFWLKLDGIIRP